MVVLKNIKRQHGILSADYYPEGDEESGSISISEQDQSEVDCTMSPNDRGTYRRFAILGLTKLIGVEDLPEKKTVMWY